jgi:hypothetical protein
MTLVNEGNIDADLIIDLRDKEGVKELEGVDGLSITAEKQVGQDDEEQESFMQSLNENPDEVGGNDDDELFDQLNDSASSSDDEEGGPKKKRIFRISIKKNSKLNFKLTFAP